MLNKEDYKDVKGAMGAGMARKVSHATNDAKSKALAKKAGKKNVDDRAFDLAERQNERRHAYGRK